MMTQLSKDHHARNSVIPSTPFVREIPSVIGASVSITAFVTLHSANWKIVVAGRLRGG